MWQAVQSHRRRAFLAASGEESSYQLSYQFSRLTFSGSPGLLTGLGERQDKYCPGRKQQSRASIIKSQSLGTLASASPSLLEPACWPTWRHVRARVSRTRTWACAPPPQPSSRIARPFFSLWFHLDFECYLIQPGNRSCFFED